MNEPSEHSVSARKNFTIVPNGVIAADIKPTAFKVYVALRSYLREGSPTLPHIDTVCKKFRIARSSFIAATKELEAAGLLEVRKRSYAGGFRTANLYYFPDVDDVLDIEGLNPAPPEVLFPAPPGVQVSDPGGKKKRVNKRRDEEDLSKRAAHSIPADYELSVSMRDYILKNKPGLNPEVTFAGFLRYWLGRPEVKRANWELTWRKWIDRENDDTKTVPALPDWAQRERNKFRPTEEQKNNPMMKAWREG